jgi:hypothetical protein
MEMSFGSGFGTSEKAEGGGKFFALIGVFIGAVGFAASLTAVYRGMRDLMITSGGACASGGPYAINPNQVCTSGQTTLLVGGIFAMLFFGAVLLGFTSWWNGGSTVGAGLLMWAGLFGALGWNFIELGINPPKNLASGATGWIICGVVFWLMALGGLIPGLMLLFSSAKEEKDPSSSPTAFKAPIVRANVNFKRSMPGDPAFGMTDPNAAAQAGQAPPPDQAPPTEATSSAEGFVDPVTGERIGGDDQ